MFVELTVDWKPPYFQTLCTAVSFISFLNMQISGAKRSAAQLLSLLGAGTSTSPTAECVIHWNSVLAKEILIWSLYIAPVCFPLWSYHFCHRETFKYFCNIWSCDYKQICVYRYTIYWYLWGTTEQSLKRSNNNGVYTCGCGKGKL